MGENLNPGEDWGTTPSLNICTLTTKFAQMSVADRATDNQHMMQNYAMPLKQWINDTDCSTLATLKVHDNYIANSNNAKLLTWYCGDNKSGTILATNKKCTLRESLELKMKL